MKQRKNKICFIISLISLIIGIICFGIFLLFVLLGSFMCGQLFYIIDGADGPIPICRSIAHTDFIYLFLIGLFLLLIGGILLFLYNKKLNIAVNM